MEFCGNANGTLATITTNNSDYLKQQSSLRDAEVWIGSYRTESKDVYGIANAPNQGEWVWVNGAESDVSEWEGGHSPEMLFDDTKRCAMLRRRAARSGSMRDATLKPFVCANIEVQ